MDKDFPAAFKFSLELEGEKRISASDLFELLEKISSFGSISRASSSMGLSYRYSWGLIREAEKSLGVTLVEKQVGGYAGGGKHPLPMTGMISALLYTGMGFPPVVIGLFVFIMFSSVGPMGYLGWLFTTKAMITAQTIIAFPLVAGFTMAAVLSVDKNLIKQLKALGATKLQASWAAVKEARIGVLVSIIAGFGGIISEVGAVMLVGGNIAGKTRVLTTAIVLETRQGNFGVAIAFGIILLTITFLANLSMIYLQKRHLFDRQ